MQKDRLIEVDILDLAYGARGVARDGNFVWFVDGALPGQKVLARVRRRKKQYGEAVLHEVIQPSPHQIEPPCPYFGTCGGCRLQHLDYSLQVMYKDRQLKEILQRVGSVTPETFYPPVPADSLYHYRNKMEYTFSNRIWRESQTSPEKQYGLGLHVPGRFDKVLDIDACLLPSAVSNRILRLVREKSVKSGLPAYNPRTHAGFWRFLVIREGKRTGELMVNVITSGSEAKGSETVRQLADTLHREIPEITTVLHSISDRPSQVAFGDIVHVLSGSGKIKEMLDGRIFEISPSAFFQTNTFQAEKLFRCAAEMARLKGNETVFDLYCGTGAIGITLASLVKKVVGIEVIPEAVENGRKNASLNALANIVFIEGDMKNALRDPGLYQQHGRPDLLILDPPRGGTHPRTLEDLIHIGVPRILYISCNPAILARDLQVLCAQDYITESVRLVDMFPQTAHIEAVAILKRKDSL